MIAVERPFYQNLCCPARVVRKVCDTFASGLECNLLRQSELEAGMRLTYASVHRLGVRVFYYRFGN